MNISEIEEFLKQINSVLSCKVVADKNENIQEIHILSDVTRNPKQLSRDIQSSLISKFSIDINHRKISIAQIDEKALDEREFRLKLKSVEFSTTSTRADVKVILEKDGEVFQGQASGANTVLNSQRIIVSAALDAIETFLGVEFSFTLEDIKMITLAEREAVVTAISFLSSHGEQIFSGCAFVNNDSKEAVVKSALDAINRRVMKYYSGS